MHKPKAISIEECRPSQLKTLLELAHPEDTPKGLPIHATDPDELQRLITELFDDRPRSGERFVAALYTADTPLEELRSTKDTAKRLIARARTPAHRDAATLIYHAAVAAAFGRFGVSISTRPMQARVALYEDLATLLAGSPLGHIFRHAVDQTITDDLK